jgi:hypothetical protein
LSEFLIASAVCNACTLFGNDVSGSLKSVILSSSENKAQKDDLLVNLQYLSIQMSKPGMLKFDKYQAYKKQMQSLMKENERMINLKDPMQVVPIKVDYDKFYNNPDKPKQERYQAWLKYVAKDRQIAESCKLLGYFNPVKLAAK